MKVIGKYLNGGFYNFITFRESNTMKNYETIDIYYDEQGDFLEVSFGLPPETEYTEDIEEGIFVTKDRKTDEVKSVGILSFKARARETLLKNVLKRLGMSIHLDISVPK